jgi:very-short-patch-repair endonuclease
MVVPVGRSKLEDVLANRIRIANLPEPQVEYRFAPPRKFRADFAWPEHGLLVEVEGGIWSGGRHTRGSGFQTDIEKYNLATLMGFKVLRFTRDHIESGEAIDTIRQALSTTSLPPSAA